MSESPRSTVSASEFERVLRQLNVATDSRRQLDRELRVASEKNQKLVLALGKVKAEVERMRVSIAQSVVPPLNSATVLRASNGRTTYDQLASGKAPAETDPYVDVLLGGRMVRVPVSAIINFEDLKPGKTVLINENTEIVLVLDEYDTVGDVVTVREILDDGRVVLELPNQGRTVARISGNLEHHKLAAGDSVTYNSKIGMVMSQVPSTDAADLVLEEVPDVTYENIGGLSSQIEQIQDAVELPFLHPEIFSEYQLTPPKGILLYGPPGNGKTLIAKAVANSLAQRASELAPGQKKSGYFLNIKGPELLDKFVGETERQIRDIFSAARERAAQGNPVVVFFDEMESLFRTRGTGRSSDVETTIVPQLLSEIDGVESLDNVIVIGATNREDMIDPAVLRPGRLDIKIRINRPDETGAREIFRLYLTHQVPLDSQQVTLSGSVEQAIEDLIDVAVSQLFYDSVANRYLSVSLDNGENHWLYRGQFLSGAVIRNIVDNAKKFAVKDQLKLGTRGVSAQHLKAAIRAEFVEQIEVPQIAEIEDVLMTMGIRHAVVSAVPVVQEA